MAQKTGGQRSRGLRRTDGGDDRMAVGKEALTQGPGQQNRSAGDQDGFNHA
jgi:hypothetical protein